MNYFELFEIPIQLKVDSADVAKKYFALSRKYHPDYFINESDDVQALALEKSAMLNKALQTFKQPDETIKYVLTLKGVLQEEEKYELPPDFLMEMMDINETLLEAETKTDIENIQLKLKDWDTAIYKPVQPIIDNYSEENWAENELLAVKDYYFKKKYLNRIREQLARMT